MLYKTNKNLQTPVRFTQTGPETIERKGLRTQCTTIDHDDESYGPDRLIPPELSEPKILILFL